MESEIKRVPITNETLAMDLKRGDKTEWKKTLFIKKTINLVRKQCYKMNRFKNFDCDDLISDCYTRIFEYLHTYDPERSRVSTWMTWVVRSVLADILKKHSRKPDKFHIEQNDEFIETLSSDEDIIWKTKFKYVAEAVRKDNLFSHLFDVENCLITINECAFKQAFPYNDLNKELTEEEEALFKMSKKAVIGYVRKRVLKLFEKHGIEGRLVRYG